MNLPYDLENPVKQYTLPKKYKEISGIWPLQGADSLVFVQDEAVQVHQFDLSSEEITEYVNYQPGDSEDLVIVANTTYILHAGKQPAIYKIDEFNSMSAQCERYDLNLDKGYDPEGLCLDATGDCLLVACKGSPVKGDKLRKIFSFNFQTGARANSPVLTIDSRDFLVKPKDTFNPSGIAIHPRSKDFYLIGTKGVKMLVCYGSNGVFKGAWELDKKQFIQPEGIAFMESGELLIASEGGKGKKGKKARIYIFAFEGE